jgi:hypothetical protein
MEELEREQKKRDMEIYLRNSDTAGGKHSGNKRSNHTTEGVKCGILRQRWEIMDGQSNVKTLEG